jgi:hypothetical protein
MEQAIRGLLKQDGGTVNPSHASVQGNKVPISSDQSPETYFGLNRGSDYVGAQEPSLGTQTFAPINPISLPTNGWALGGTWDIGGQNIVAGDNATLYFHFAAKNVYMVGGASNSSPVKVLLNGKPISMTSDAGADVHDNRVNVRLSTLYRIVSLPSFNSNDTVELQVPAGVSLNTFTFGS